MNTGPTGSPVSNGWIRFWSRTQRNKRSSSSASASASLLFQPKTLNSIQTHVKSETKTTRSAANAATSIPETLWFPVAMTTPAVKLQPRVQLSVLSRTEESFSLFIRSASDLTSFSHIFSTETFSNFKLNWKPEVGHQSSA